MFASAILASRLSDGGGLGCFRCLLQDCVAVCGHVGNASSSEPAMQPISLAISGFPEQGTVGVHCPMFLTAVGVAGSFAVTAHLRVSRHGVGVGFMCIQQKMQECVQLCVS